MRGSGGFHHFAGRYSAEPTLEFGAAIRALAPIARKRPRRVKLFAVRIVRFLYTKKQLWPLTKLSKRCLWMRCASRPLIKSYRKPCRYHQTPSSAMRVNCHRRC